MADWAAFAGLTGVVLVLLLALSHLTTTALSESGVVDADDERRGTDPTARSVDTAVSHPDEDGPHGPADNERDAEIESTAAVDSSDGSPEDRLDDESGSPLGANGRASGADVETENAAGADGETENATSVDGETENASSVGGETDRPSSEATGPAGGRADRPRAGSDPTERLARDSLSTGEMLANVAFSQGLFAAILIAAAVYTEIPPKALGIVLERSALVDGLRIGVALGLALYVANELGSLTAKRLGIDHDEELRELLAPDSVGGWLVLLVLVLPLIAVFEEFLFRAALVGAFSTGFTISPWLLAVLSSVAFAIGHGIQGPTGVAVTGLLGLVLAAAFIFTGSLLVVVVAHYLVNALEFVVHEGVGFEWNEVG